MVTNSLEPIDMVPKHAVHALVSFRRHAWVLRMTGHADLVLVGHWDHAIEKVSDTLPKSVGVYVPSPGERGCGMRLRELPCVVHRIAAPWDPSCAEHAEDAHVVFD
jgi:hypothetical protein